MENNNSNKEQINQEIKPKIFDFGYCMVEKVAKKPKMFYNVCSSPQACANNKYS